MSLMKGASYSLLKAAGSSCCRLERHLSWLRNSSATISIKAFLICFIYK